MATLYVENIPEDLYDGLRERARQHRKSIAAEVLALLQQNLVTPAEQKARKLAVRQARWPRSAGETAIRTLTERQIPTVSSLSLRDDAFAIASSFDRSVYDSLYVALAVSVKTNLVTADEKLANALAAHLPVKWLGSFL